MMRKALALLVAFATAFTVSVTAFADGVPDTMADTFGYGSTQGTAVSPFNLEWDTGDNLTIGEHEMFYVYAEGDRVGKVLEPGEILTPDNEYVFDIYYTTGSYTGTPTDLLDPLNSARVTKGLFDGGKLRVRTVKGSSGVASISLEEKGSNANATYQLEIDAKANYGTKLNDVEYAMEVTGAGPAATPLIKSGVAFKVGFPKMDDDDINAYEEGDVITIYNDAPVISKKQFETLAKAYNYKAITFEDENDTWTFTGRISGMSDTNWFNTEEIIPGVVMDYPDTDFKFVNFHGGVKLPANGEMRIDVSDISGDFEQMYVYLSRGGAMTPITAAHDRDTDEIVFKTNYLGTFIISEDEIALSNQEPEEPTDPNDPDYVPPAPTNPANPSPTNPTNPGTGASPAMDMITAIGLAALTGAGSLLRKKR